jgi:hypothetical protein
MLKRSSNDAGQVTAEMVRGAVEAIYPATLIVAKAMAAAKVARAKNPAAVALGRIGGLAGGRARAASLSKARRSEIAAKAAAARWGKRPARSSADA